tara:strand:- start:7587 stop:7820 length:234 start_codon:yes stop_codon:yes gene_type:complete
MSNDKMADRDWWWSARMWFQSTNKVVNTHTIYVLEDGETYSGAPAVALSVSEDEMERIDGGEKIYNVVPDWATRGDG